ncbi:MAG TPA: WbqC family protein [Saprospiraceae bacterium]|nr:WbqC family protein [Saprospiraceae bacterium]
MTSCVAGSQYMPSVEYFAHWLYHGGIVIEAHEHFQKRSWRNKTAIQGPEKPLYLSVPLRKGKNNQLPIREVAIAYDEPWFKIHDQSIRTAYGKTPFFEEIEQDIHNILFSQHERLWDLNLQAIQFFTGLIPGNWPLTFSNEYNPVLSNEITDIRYGIPAGRTIIELQALPIYNQIHRLTKSHLPNLSILDVLCHLGPETKDYIVRYSKQLYQ